ncbi:unnamed protein product [[Candida] boidinii]|nr:unnamed protein product [[Candida] boidinii]
MSFITNSWNKFRTYTAPEKMLVETYLTGKKLTYSVVALSALSIFFFGYDQGLMSGVNASPDYVDHMKFGYSLDDGTVIVTDSVKQGGIVAIYYFGTLWGALFGGIVSDDIGRIKSIALGAATAIVGAALQCSAQQTAWMCGARFVNGLGTGVLNAVVPVYTSETAESTSRGAYLAIEFTLNIFGVVVAYWLEFGLSFIDGGFSAFRWRFPIAFQILFLLVLLAIVWFFPESPRWLVKNGDQARARSLLVKMRGEEDGDREFNEIVAALSYEEDSALSSNYLSMFFDWYRGSEEQVAKAKKLHIARRVQLCVWFQIIQEWIENLNGYLV